MPTAHLLDRAVVSVEGPDAEHFLQNIVTTDLDQLEAGEAKPGALLTPQGKILFDFLVSRSGGQGFLLDIRAEVADDFVRRLMLYRLRAKAEIAKQDQLLVLAGWENESAPSSTESWLADRRFPEEANVRRLYADAATEDAGEDGWNRLRIAYGIAESGADYQLGDAFPHDVLLDETGGIGFRKGCYVGQEVVSRMQHRGTARRRVMIVEGEAPLPPAGTEIRANDRPIGTLGSVDGPRGLAVLRIDRVKSARDAGHAIMAGEVRVEASIPGWANYTLPQDAQAGEG